VSYRGWYYYANTVSMGKDDGGAKYKKRIVNKKNDNNAL